MPARILIVDDHSDILAGLKERLEWLGYYVLTATDGGEALSIIQQNALSMVLLDLELPVLNGLEVLKRLNELRTQASGPFQISNAAPYVAELTPPIVILTAFGSINRAVEAMKLGACDFLTKPFDVEHLALVVRKILDRELLKKEVRLLRSEVEGRYSTIVAESRSMKEVLAASKRGAVSDAVILIQGETGTGKELLARAIHRWSSRAEGPFMAMNCAAFQETLLENELFGHERGAFTGATHLQEGKIEAADGGTVFLDEIGDMPFPMQSRLLRLLQDKEFHRIGGTQPVRVNVRFVAATNKDLSAAVKEGGFREDLFYRLSVFPITLPPLRDRREDILRIATHIVEQECAKHGVGHKELGTRANEALCHYHWPGNIRELENVLARAIILSETSEIQTAHLGLPAVVACSQEEKNSNGETELPYHASMESHSRWLISEALRRSQGNQTKAAAILRLQRTYLTKLLKQKGILGNSSED